MSSRDGPDETPEADAAGTEPVGTDAVDTETVDPEQVGGLGELVPESLAPVWRRVEAVQEFRRTYGDTYVTVLEAIVAVALTGGYLYWLFLYLTG